MSLNPGPVRVSVPATSANLGPAFDCAGLALGLRDDIEVEVIDIASEPAAQVHVSGEGAGRVPMGERHLVVRAVRRALAALDATPGQAATLRLDCRNAIPQGRGLGSSAAAIIGGLVLGRALVAGGASRLSDEQILRLALEFEPHPDNVAAALLGGCTLSWFDDPQDHDTVHATRLLPDPRIRMAVAIPPTSLSTSSARRHLPTHVPLVDAAFNAGRSALLVAALTTAPDLLIAATEDRLHQEARRDLYPESMALVDRLRVQGIAAVISGAGPTVLAFGVEEPGLLEAHLRSTAPQGWRTLELHASAVGVQQS